MGIRDIELAEVGAVGLSDSDSDDGGAVVAPSAPAAPAAPPAFNFYGLLWEIHGRVVALPGYRAFLLRYAALQGVRLVTALSFLVAVYAMGAALDLDAVTSRQAVVLGLVGALNVFGRLTPFATALAVDGMKNRLQCAMATAVVAKLFDLPYDAMLSTPTGEFVQLISKVFVNMDKVLPAFYGVVVPVAVETVFGVAFVAYAYGWIAVAQLGLFLVLTRIVYARAEAKAARNSEMTMAMLSEWGRILAGAQSYERAHVFGNVGAEVETVRACFERIGTKIGAVQAIEHKEGAQLTFLSLATTLAFLALLPAAAPDAEGVELAALALYFFIYIGGLDAYGQGVSNLRSAVFEYRQLKAFTDAKSAVADGPRADEMVRAPRPAVEFRNVTFDYGGRKILDDVSFTCGKGETLGIVGASGCGKSTVLRLLLRFYGPSAGAIYVDGKDIAEDVTGASLRSLFSVVTQDAQIFNGTVRENVAYAKAGADDAAVLAACARAGLTFDDDFTLDKDCGERGGKLSGGQQQRVSLARAILKSGSLFLLDEPTTGLDNAVAKALQATLEELSADATTITITHHLEDLENAHKILYLDAGKIVERGTYAELMAAKGAFHDQVHARR